MPVTWTERRITKDIRTDGKYNISVRFFRGYGADRQPTSTHLMYEKVGPKKAEILVGILQQVLDAAWAQGLREGLERNKVEN